MNSDGYLINEYCMENLNLKNLGLSEPLRARIGMEVDFKIENDVLILINPRVYLRLLNNMPFLFVYLDGADAVNYADELENAVKLFYKHLDRLENDMEYNKKIVKHFKNLKGYPEDVFDGLYYEFNFY